MKNKFPGTCFRCGKPVKAGEGKLAGIKRGVWRMQHEKCFQDHRKNLPKCTCIGRDCKGC